MTKCPALCYTICQHVSPRLGAIQEKLPQGMAITVVYDRSELVGLRAIDFALIIDGAVVMVENIVCKLAHRQAHLRRTLTPEERAHVVLSASEQVGNPMFFGVLIITLVYLPILALSGIEGKMFRPTVMLALA